MRFHRLYFMNSPEPCQVVLPEGFKGWGVGGNCVFRYGFTYLKGAPNGRQGHTICVKAHGHTPSRHSGTLLTGNLQRRKPGILTNAVCRDLIHRNALDRRSVVGLQLWISHHTGEHPTGNGVAGIGRVLRMAQTGEHRKFATMTLQGLKRWLQLIVRTKLCRKPGFIGRTMGIKDRNHPARYTTLGMSFVWQRGFDKRKR